MVACPTGYTFAGRRLHCSFAFVDTAVEIGWKTGLSSHSRRNTTADDDEFVCGMNFVLTVAGSCTLVPDVILETVLASWQPGSFDSSSLLDHRYILDHYLLHSSRSKYQTAPSTPPFPTSNSAVPAAAVRFPPTSMPFAPPTV